MVIRTINRQLLQRLLNYINNRLGYPDGVTETYSVIWESPKVPGLYAMKVKSRDLPALKRLRDRMIQRVNDGVATPNEIKLVTLEEPVEPDNDWEPVAVTDAVLKKRVAP